MVHYFAAVQSRGSLDWFDTESPKRLHIDYAKEAYRASNKKEYIQQMMVWLGRQEAVAWFRAYLDYVTGTALDPSISDKDTHDNKDNEIEEPADHAQADLSPHHTHSVAVKLALPHMDFNTPTTHFKATNFIPILSTYTRHLIPPLALPILSNLMDHFDVYKCITILQPSNPAAGFPKSINQLCATPSVPAKGRSKAVPTHFDIVLVQVVDVIENWHTSRLSMGRARSLWPRGWPGPTLKGWGPGQRIEGLAPNRRAKGQQDLEGWAGPNLGRTWTYH